MPIIHEVEGFLVDEYDGYTEHYWSCDCNVNNLALVKEGKRDDIKCSWFELWCEECGLKREEGHSVSMEEVVEELKRDGRLQGVIREYFDEANEYHKNVMRGLKSIKVKKRGK